MAEYGFTSSDIASITQARSNLSAGFMQLGQQIEKDIERIATLRETKAFAAEMATLDPTQDNFPQQLIGTLSKYPLASQTNLAKQGVEVLSSRYKTAQELKVNSNLFTDLGGGVMHNPKTGVTYRKNASGIPEFFDATPQSPRTVPGRIVNEIGPDGKPRQVLVNPVTSETIREFGPVPQSTRSTNVNALPQGVKMLIDNYDDRIKGITTERQRLLDAINSGKFSDKDTVGKDGLGNPISALKKAYNDLANLDSALKIDTDQRNKLIRQYTPDMPTGAGQGINGPSLMPEPQRSGSMVPMQLDPNEVISNPGMPNRDQMVQNTPDTVLTPDQMPVMPTPKQDMDSKKTRLYRKVNGQIEYFGNDLLKAVLQARDDDQIDDAEARRVLDQSGKYRRK